MDETVGVRELRQNLSRYLDEVKRGKRLVVTEHNRPVAELGPVRDGLTARERLVADGRVIPATAPLEPRPIKLPGGPRPGTDALEYVRGERG